MEEYRRWEDNIKMDLKEIGVNVRSWIDSAQDRGYWRALVDTALCSRMSFLMAKVISDCLCMTSLMQRQL